MEITDSAVRESKCINLTNTVNNKDITKMNEVGVIMSVEQKLEFKKEMLKSLTEMLKLRGLLSEDDCRKMKMEFDKISN